MTIIGIAQIILYLLIVLLITKPIGLFMTRVFQGERTCLHPILRPVERLIYRLAGIQEDVEQSWTRYAASLLSLSLFSVAILYVLQRFQGWLPLNPQQLGTAAAAQGATPMTPDLAFNTAISFMTNTNWQAYVPETTMSYLTQMAGLTVQNFLSAAVGISVAVALIRGFARETAKGIGNFWVDVTRTTVYILLPISVLAALFLCWQGSIQNLKPYQTIQTLDGSTQLIAQGPVASQEAIKMLGTNGGGFFNANSAHPYENPTPLSNMFQMLLILCIPAGLTYVFGKMVRDTRQGWALFAAMSVLFLCGVFAAYWAEQAGNPIISHLGVESHYTGSQAGGNMEGKEVRFGNAATSLFATVTTDTSCGAVIAMHDSLTPLGGLVTLFNIQLGELVFGGTGAGLYSMLIYAIIGVFIAGLMVGRTPEYQGKKIERKEVKMAMIALIATAACILVFTSIGSVISFAKDSYWNGSYGPATGNLNNSGPHGFSELLYTYTSGTANQGSAFAGISANTPWYNLTLALVMLVGRFFYIIPVLAIAGSLAAKKRIPVTSGTLPTHTSLFVGFLVATIVIVGALTFVPALALGPIVEHFFMHSGRLF